MFLVLALFTLVPCVDGLSRLEAAEGANLTLQWDSGSSSASSGLIVSCFHTSVHGSTRTVLEVANGKQLPGSTARQFSGRVLWDGGGLSLGRFRIVLTRITARDQGLYWCSVYADYRPARRCWATERFEHFSLTVTANKRAETGSGDARREHVSLTTTGDASELSPFQRGLLYSMFAGMTLMAFSIVLVWLLYHLCPALRTH